MPKQGWVARRGQLVTTYGVGATIAVGASSSESVMVVGIDRWMGAPNDLHEPRLERQLHVDGFRRPPASEDQNDVPVVRFPRWVSCPDPSCPVGLEQHRRLTSKDSNQCPECLGDLLPSRFVVACQRGHIDDFPYWWWVHRGSSYTDTEHLLDIESRGTSSALRDILISCSCGITPRTMDGAFSKGALEGHSCSGARPWLPGTEAEVCPELPRVLQRGASNVWYPILRSALSIPPWSEGIFRILERHWAVLRAIPEEALRATIESLYQRSDLEAAGYSVDDLTGAVRSRKHREQSPEEGDVPLRAEEFAQLDHGRPETGPADEFVCEPADGVTRYVATFFSRVMLVKRLLEVRVLEAFARVLPPSPADPPEYRAPLAAEAPTWLPAIDVSGEGVFLRLDDARLAEWEARPTVRARVMKIDANYRRIFGERGAEPDRVITPRLVLVHTLAHALVGQWALESGYPAASLRERLFVAAEYAGLLIYTATSDSAGSLGGVIQLARSDRLEAALREAVDRASWCSSDPLCVEADASGVDSLNLAACHACVLLPEVSCEEMNTLLDRALIAGAPGRPELSFFGSDG